MSDEKHLCCLKSSLRHDWSTYKLFISLMYHMKPEAISIINICVYIHIYAVFIFTRNNIVWVLSNRTTYLTHPPSIMSPSTTALQRNQSDAIFFIHQRSAKHFRPARPWPSGRSTSSTNPSWRSARPGLCCFLFWNFFCRCGLCYNDICMIYTMT